MKIRDTEIKIVKGDTGSLDVDAVLDVDVSFAGGSDEGKWRQACAEALSSAAGKKVESVALKLSWQKGRGEGLSVVGAAKVMAQEILKFYRGGCRDNSRVVPAISNIIICLDDDETYQTFNTTVHGYIDHIQDDLGSGPYVTVDIIIELSANPPAADGETSTELSNSGGKEGIILIERSNPPYGWALPGGFVDCGESLEETARREAKEETNMDLEGLRQFHTYSKPDRDPRFHTVSTVFIAKGKGTPQFGDDAKGLKIVNYADLLDRDYAFDHKQIIQDYLNQKS